MRVISDETLGYSWKGWAGGCDTLEELTLDEIEVIERELNELYPEGINEVELNDFLWFERDQIAEMLAYNDWEDLMEHRNYKITPANLKRTRQ